jgi:hypothetical protein
MLHCSIALMAGRGTRCGGDSPAKQPLEVLALVGGFLFRN